MAKFFGEIGYAEMIETSPGIHEEVITEHKYYGDVIRDTRRLEKGDGLNSDVNIRNLISIVADAFAFQNFFAIRYVRWMGTTWIVTDIEVNRPRLILTIGGVYNGTQT